MVRETAVWIHLITHTGVCFSREIWCECFILVQASPCHSHISWGKEPSPHIHKWAFVKYLIMNIQFSSSSLFLVSTALFCTLTVLHPSLLPAFPYPHDWYLGWSLDNDFQWTNCDNLTVCFDVSWDLLILKMLISLIEKRKDKEGFYARYSSH